MVEPSKNVPGHVHDLIESFFPWAFGIMFAAFALGVVWLFTMGLDRLIELQAIVGLVEVVDHDGEGTETVPVLPIPIVVLVTLLPIYVCYVGVLVVSLLLTRTYLRVKGVSEVDRSDAMGLLCERLGRNRWLRPIHRLAVLAGC